MDKIKVGIVGASFGGAVHLPAYQNHPRFEVVAIASPNRARDIAAAHHLRSFTSAEELLEEVDIDLLSVASPPFDHHRSVMAAIARGKHVLSEKPMALNLAQAEEMAAAGQKAGVVGALAFEFRYIPSLLIMKQRIEAGHFGPLRQIEITRSTSELLLASTGRSRGWWFRREDGGGIANSIMPHLLDLALHLAGRAPARSVGFLRTANPERQDKEGPFTSTVADGGFATLDFGEGLVGCVRNDSVNLVELSRFGVHGETGSIVSTGPNFGQLETVYRTATEQGALEVPPAPYAESGAIHPNLPFFMSLLDDLAMQIDTGQSAVPTFQDGLNVQRILCALGYEAR